MNNAVRLRQAPAVPSQALTVWRVVAVDVPARHDIFETAKLLGFSGMTVK
jgi:hypothetical protein